MRAVFRTRVAQGVLVVALALSAGVGVFLLYPTSPAVARPLSLVDYGHTTIVIHSPDHTSHAWRVLRADTLPLIEHGLMGVTDPQLGGYVGMLFEFAGPTTAPFWMKDTPLPLAVVFVDPTGVSQSPVDMAPCGASNTCPTYSPQMPYLYALEVPRGGLDALNLVPGSTIEVPSP